MIEVDDDVLDALLPEDRAWLRAHGWQEPPPRPRWADGDFAVRCRACGKALSVEYVAATTWARPFLLRVAAEPVADVLERHRPDCEAAA